MRHGPWKMLPGWFNYADLYEHAVDISKDGDTLVEIGVAFGRSLSYLAQCARESGKKLRIVAIDPFATDLQVWGAEYSDWAKAVGGPLAAFELLVKRHDPELARDAAIHRNKGELYSFESASVHVVVDRAEDIAPIVADQSCSFVFIDGDHRYDAVKRDCELWEPKVRDGGILAGHDFTPGDACGIDVVRYVSKAYPKAEIWTTSWVHRIVAAKAREELYARLKQAHQDLKNGMKVVDPKHEEQISKLTEERDQWKHKYETAKPDPVTR